VVFSVISLALHCEHIKQNHTIQLDVCIAQHPHVSIPAKVHAPTGTCKDADQHPQELLKQ
jgi:hypothetical protein